MVHLLTTPTKVLLVHNNVIILLINKINRLFKYLNQINKYILVLLNLILFSLFFLIFHYYIHSLISIFLISHTLTPLKSDNINDIVISQLYE